MINILLFNSSSVSLNNGYTLNDYIIRANANNVSYDKLCEKLHITVDEAKASYDKTWNIPLEAIGKVGRVSFLKTGADWRKQ